MTTTAPTQFLYPYQAQPVSAIQSVGAASAVSGPTTYTQTVAATKVGTQLVWIVAVNASASAALGATPSGWTLVASQVVATLALGIYTYLNNPGGITSIVLSSPTATAGGIASWFYEVSSAGFLEKANTATGSSTSPSPGANYTPTYTNELIIGARAWVSTAGAPTLTITDVPAIGTTAPWVDNTAQVSANGTTNAALQTSTLLNSAWQATAYNVAGTLSAGVVWDAALLVFQTGLSQTLRNVTDSGIAGTLAGSPGSYAVGG